MSEGGVRGMGAHRYLTSATPTSNTGIQAHIHTVRLTSMPEVHILWWGKYHSTISAPFIHNANHVFTVNHVEGERAELEMNVTALIGGGVGLVALGLGVRSSMYTGECVWQPETRVSWCVHGCSGRGSQSCAVQ